MGYRDQVRSFTVHARTTNHAVHVRAAELVFESIVEGSPITGAPGQPIRTRALHDSWTLTHPAPDLARVASTSPYAIAVEENVRGMKLKNHGPHSRALTHAGWDRIVAVAAAEVVK